MPVRASIIAMLAGLLLALAIGAVAAQAPAGGEVPPDKVRALLALIDDPDGPRSG